MLLVIVIAVVLLTLLLVSFLLTSRREGDLEKRLSAMSGSLKQLSDALNEIKASVDPLTQRIKISEQSSTYLSDHAQKLDDSLEELTGNFSAVEGELADLKSKFSRKFEDLERTRPEGAPIAEARQMLRDGAQISEISKRTSLPPSEIEMIAKVSGIRAHSNAQSEPKPKEPAPAADGYGQTIEASAPQKHIASLRARNAYGMGQGLRRSH